MLLDDDDDIQGNQGMNNQNNYTPGTGNQGNNNSLDGGTMDMDMEVMMQNSWDIGTISAKVMAIE